MKTPEQMAIDYIKDVETARNPSIATTAFPQLQRCFLAGYQAAQQWISVKDRLPKIGTDVLVKVSKDSVMSDDNGNNPEPIIYDFYSVMSLYYQNGQHIWDTRPITDACPLKWDDVTHWMPLPDEPKEEK